MQIDLPEFTPKDWMDAPSSYRPGIDPRPSGATDIDAEALEDIEVRLSGHTDDVGEILAIAVETVDGTTTAVSNRVTLLEAASPGGAGSGVQITGPTLPVLPPGTEYVWNKTDGHGALLDILSGVIT